MTTFYRVAHLVYWPSMRSDIRKYVRQCIACQQAKISQLSSAGLLEPLPIPAQIWEDISMDFIIGLPPIKGNLVILVVVDRLSKYEHFIPLADNFTSSRVAKVFV